MILITIQTDNDVFQDDKAEELARILRQLATKAEAGHEFYKTKIRDLNGNTCGTIHDTDFGKAEIELTEFEVIS